MPNRTDGATETASSSFGVGETTCDRTEYSRPSPRVSGATAVVSSGSYRMTPNGTLTVCGGYAIGSHRSTKSVRIRYRWSMAGLNGELGARVAGVERIRPCSASGSELRHVVPSN